MKLWKRKERPETYQVRSASGLKSINQHKQAEKLAQDMAGQAAEARYHAELSNVDEDIWAVRSPSVKSEAKSTSVEETEKQTPARVTFVVDAREEEENPSELNSDHDDERNTEDLADEIPQAEHEVVKVQEEGITFIRLNSEPEERTAEDLFDEIPLAEHEVVNVEEEDILRFFVKKQHNEAEEDETDDDDVGEPSQSTFGCLPDADGIYLSDVGKTLSNATTSAATYVASEGGKAIKAGSIALSNAAVQGYNTANEAVENMVFRSDNDAFASITPLSALYDAVYMSREK